MAGLLKHSIRFASRQGGTCSLTSENMYIGYYNGSSGTYGLSGGLLLSNSSNLIIGFSGLGSFMQTGGTCSLNYGMMQVGQNGDAPTTYTLSGGLLSANSANPEIGVAPPAL